LRVDCERAGERSGGRQGGCIHGNGKFSGGNPSKAKKKVDKQKHGLLLGPLKTRAAGRVEMSPRAKQVTGIAGQAYS